MQVSRQVFRKLLPFLALPALAVLGMGARPASAQAYTVTDLGSLNPAAINASGMIAGSSGAHAALWVPTVTNGSSGTLQSLGTLAGQTSSVAHGLNDAGAVVGTASGSTNDAAFLWTASGGMQTVAVPNGSPQSYGYGINSNGQVVGFAGDIRLNTSSTNMLLHAFSSGAAGAVDLGTLPPPSLATGYPATSYAYSINDAGEVVGSTAYTLGPRPGSSLSRACYWTPDGTVVSLNLPSEPNNYNDYSYANGGNKSGQIFGSYTDLTTSTTKSFIWTPGSGVQYVGSAIRQSSGISAINDVGQAVGAAYLGGLPFAPLRHALIFQATVGLDLNTMIDPLSNWTLNTTTGINNNGEIIGLGTRVINGQTVTRSFLLTPTPEPSQTAALGLGVLGLARLALKARKHRRCAKR